MPPCWTTSFYRLIKRKYISRELPFSPAAVPVKHYSVNQILPNLFYSEIPIFSLIILCSRSPSITSPTNCASNNERLKITPKSDHMAALGRIRLRCQAENAVLQTRTYISGRMKIMSRGATVAVYLTSCSRLSACE